VKKQLRISALRVLAGAVLAAIIATAVVSADATAAKRRGPWSLGDRVPVAKGMRGHDVKVLQDFLRRAGIAQVTIDGEFGPATLRAVKAFQSSAQLAVDGRVDADDVTTLRGLVKAGDARTGSPTTTTATTPGDKAQLTPDGLAVAPESAPEPVKQVIAAANRIAKKPYVYGGGHGEWEDDGYDCSGSMSYALHGGGLLDKPLVSGDFPSWGDPGPGQWITVYGNDSHGFLMVAGLRFDTSGLRDDGTRWHTTSHSTGGYGVSHPPGL